MYGILCDHPKIIEYLLEKKADVEKKDTVSKRMLMCTLLCACVYVSIFYHATSQNYCIMLHCFTITIIITTCRT